MQLQPGGFAVTPEEEGLIVEIRRLHSQRRKPRVQRTPEEKWQIVLEGLKSGNVAETCRKYEIAPNLYYRWKDEVEAGAKAALGGRSAAAQPDVEQEKRIKQLERALGRSHLQIEILKNVLGE